MKTPDMEMKREYMRQTVYGVNPARGFCPDGLHAARIDDAYFVDSRKTGGRIRKVPFNLRKVVDYEQELVLFLNSNKISEPFGISDIREIVHFLSDVGVEHPTKVAQLKDKLVTVYTKGPSLDGAVGIGV
jgi:hypothetical protein